MPRWLCGMRHWHISGASATACGARGIGRRPGGHPGGKTVSQMSQIYQSFVVHSIALHSSDHQAWSSLQRQTTQQMTDTAADTGIELIAVIVMCCLGGCMCFTGWCVSLYHLRHSFFKLYKIVMDMHTNQQ